MTDSNQLFQIEEPNLVFNFSQQMEHPKDGLMLYGPYENHLSGGKLRIGLISTKDGAERYKRWVTEISKPIKPAKNNDPNHTIFPGFQAIFGTEWPVTPTISLQLNAQALSHAIHMEDRYQAIHKAVSFYADEITQYLRNKSEISIDLWIAVIPEDIYKLGRPNSKVSKSERQESEFAMNKKTANRLLREPSLFSEDNVASEIYSYDLNFHNQLKARLLQHKVVIQVIRETTLAPDDFKKANGMPLRLLQDKATLAWNLTTTAFFKAGGQPWKLSSSRRGVCYVGVVFKRDTTGVDASNACCGAQMFLDSGDGVVFRGAVGPWYSQTNKQFHLSKEKAAELMSMILQAYRESHDGHDPEELFVHGKTYFSQEEWEGFAEAVPSTCNVVCVRIKEDYSVKLFRRGMMNIQRGVAWKISETKGYIWTRGFIPRLQTYPGREVPNPLTIEIVKGQANIETVMKDVFSLTKLNYNTCIYSDGVPVTLKFADMIGEILTAGPIQNDLPPLPFRYYI